MNFNEILLESTYELGHVVDKIFKDLIEPAIKEAKAGHIDYKVQNWPLKKYTDSIVEKLYKHDYSINFYFRISKEKGMTNWFSAEEGSLNSKIYLNLSNKDIKSLDIKSIKQSITQTLTHELTHAIDRIRAKGRVKSSPEGFGADYYMDPTELNSFVNSTKTYIKKNKKKWNSIRDLEDFRYDINYIIQGIGHLMNSDFDEYLKVEKAYLKRLARENLLPRGMIT
jgi:hypothetical protein